MIKRHILELMKEITIKAWPPKVGKTVWMLDKQQYADSSLG